MKIIDIHAHVYPDPIAAKAAKSIRNYYHLGDDMDGTISKLLERGSAAGVYHYLILPVAVKPDHVRNINAFIRQQVQQHDCFTGFGTVHAGMENILEEVQRIEEMGLKGIKIHPHYQEVDIDDIRYLRLLGRAAELGLLTVMHSGQDIGFPGVVRCSPEMTASALQQLGDIPLVLAHMGGWKDWNRVADHLGPTGCLLDTALSLGQITPLEPDHYRPEELPLLDNTGFCSLVQAFGSKRILFGTDSPWEDQKTYVRRIQAMPLTEAEKEDILWRNAGRLLSV